MKTHSKNIQTSIMMGIILCGGKSTRMGSDKGLLVKDEKIWAQHIAELFIQLKMPFVVSCRTEQFNDYEKYFSHEILVTDKISKVEKNNSSLTPSFTPALDGPLNGIMSVHTNFPDKDLLVLACDMILMSVPVLENLISEYETNPDNDIWCYRINENTFVEPLCAIYSKKILKKLSDDIKSGKEMRHRLQHLVRSCHAHIIATNDNFAFSNFNFKDNRQ